MSDTAETVATRPPAALPPRRTSALAMKTGPMSPEATSEQIADVPEVTVAATPAAAPVIPEPQPGAAAVAAPAAAPGLRRMSALAMKTGPMSPDATPEQLEASPDASDDVVVRRDAATAVTAAASTDAATAINPGMAPRDATTGEFLADEDMRRRALGGGGGGGGAGLSHAVDADAAVDAAVHPAADEASAAGTGPDGGSAEGAHPSATPAATVVDPGAQDGYVPPEPIDALHDWIVQSLSGVRTEHRSGLSERIAENIAIHQSSAAELSRIQGMTMAQKQMEMQKMAAARAGGGGGGGGAGAVGGILSGVGNLVSGTAHTLASGVKGVGNVLGLTAEGAARHKVEQAERVIRDTMLERKIQTDNRLPKTIEAASNMYQAHKLLGEQVAAFNRDFGASPEGQSYLARLQAVADDQGITPKELRTRIHNGQIDGPEVAELSRQTQVLASDPAYAKRLQDMESLSTLVRSNADRMENGLKRAHADGVNLEGLDGKFSDAIGEMKLDDCALSRPGKKPLHDLSERMKEMTEKLQKMVQDLIEAIRSLFSRGPK
jgi:hypothetical protein